MAIQDRKQLTKNLFFDPIAKSLIIINNYVDPATEIEIPFVDVTSLRDALNSITVELSNLGTEIQNELQNVINSLTAMQDAFDNLGEMDGSNFIMPITVGDQVVQFKLGDFLNQLYAGMVQIDTDTVKSVNNAQPVNGNVALSAGMISGVFDMVDAYTGQIGTVTTDLESFLATLVSSIYIDYAKAVDLQTHIDLDLKKWGWVTSLRERVSDLEAGIQNKTLDRENGVDIAVLSTLPEGYLVNNALGGRIEFTAFNLLLSFGTVSLNGNEVWSSSGISLALSGISDSWEVENGDVITTTGLTQCIFYPYAPSVPE